MNAQRSTSQRGRLAILVLYLAGLGAASQLAHGSWLPPANAHGIWFYSALAAILLGSLLVTPYFTSPANAISYAVAALVTLLAVNPWLSPSSESFERLAWSAASVYVATIIAAAFVAIAAKDTSYSFGRRLGRSAHILADTAGGPRPVFSAVFLFALVTYHRATVREFLVISLAWALFVGLRPLESLAALWSRWRQVWSAPSALSNIGTVVRHESPGSVVICIDQAPMPRVGDLLLVRNELGEPAIAIAMSPVGFSDGRWLRALHMTEPPNAPFEQEAEVLQAVSAGAVFAIADHSGFPEANALARRFKESLLGVVAPDTSIGDLQLELVRDDTDVCEGRLVEVRIGMQPVLYQVIKGVTKEEILVERSRHGFVRAQARKIGSWNTEIRAFAPVPWLPQPNQPVFLVEPQPSGADRGAIGHFPGTSYPVGVDPHLLVTHNAAILGILGVGKSFLAFELIERMLASGIRVICLDLTDQYAGELGAFLDAEQEGTLRAQLAEVGPPGKTNVKKNVEEGGSVGPFAAKLKQQLTDFLNPTGTGRLRVINPTRFEVWRQDSKPYQDQASMATLTPAEITRIITETTLEVLQAQGMSEKARCCIVYEEAHSLIPEWNAVASDGDKTATNGTAKAILQGRKFGLGCLVITQRTANVTKSILNQCNTVFGLRVFDATGMEFLANYLGQNYAGVLSALPDRHAVVFGRASSCREPVLAQLNDRSDFLAVFRTDAQGTNQGALS